eukprot:CAMPEP_0196576058 /NCGR_PEP_ID=MMETSP1081-20130531/5412_1 /TAXON_ID=36882 /ORGANISM="Pyramimonas amylifera, Strain CCMP720" /LENGTH=277 /DNA_ID=CAMNT_0041894557 /DNA_START=83 /DNA_END=916 /DNA_ORIENTATION=-
MAFRRIALRFHPDVCPNRTAEQEEKFVRIQKAYMMLVRHAQTLDEMDGDFDEDDFDWGDHDFVWAWKFEKKGRKKSRGQTKSEVNSQLDGLRQKIRGKQAAGEREEALSDLAEAKSSEVGERGGQAEAHNRSGPTASQSSTPQAHNRLGKQLEGLKRAASMRKSKRSRQHHSSTSDSSSSSWHAELQSRTPTTSTALREPSPFQAQAITVEDKRFLRLARLAQEWRQRGIRTYIAKQPHFAEFTFISEDTPEDTEPTAREALLAVVQGVAIGGGFGE